MNLRQLKYFIGIIEQGSFLRASKVLRIAQPALSLHIANLEDELGTPLLIRTPRGITPTPAGEVLLMHAQKIIAQLKHAKDDVQLEANTPKGDVVLSLPPMLSGYLAPRLVLKVREHYPDVALTVIEARSLKNSRLVETGRADLGLIATPEPELPKYLAGEYLYTEPLFYIESSQKSKNAQAKHMKPITFNELAKKELAVSLKQHAVRSILEEISANKEKKLNITLETESSAVMRSYARYGAAGTVMPWPSVHHMWKQGEIIARPISQPEITRAVFISWSKNHPLNIAATVVKDFLIEEIETLFQQGIIIGEKAAEEVPTTPAE